MSAREMMHFLRSASIVPSSRDSLFEKAVTLPGAAFAKVFDGKTRSLEGFSISAPRTSPPPDSVQVQVSSELDRPAQPTPETEAAAHSVAAHSKQQ
jgi:hypothetical protein